MEAVEAPTRKKRRPRTDSESTPSYPLPTFRPFQLCTLSETIPTSDNWLFEMKLDGYRAQVAISGPEARVYTRNGHDWTEQFKVILSPLKALTTGSVLPADRANQTLSKMPRNAAGIGIAQITGDVLDLHAKRRHHRLNR